MLFAYMTCLIFTSSAAAFCYDIYPRERVDLAPRNMSIATPSAIELVEIDKTKLPLNDTTLAKLASIRGEFKNHGKVNPQEFTPVEIQQLFAKEWAYPENK